MCCINTQAQLDKPSPNGSTPGSGTSSPPSRSTIDGVRPDLLPTVVSFSPEGGLRRFLTVLASSSLSNEEGSDAPTLTLSLPLERAALTSLIETSVTDGSSDAIRFDVSIPLRSLGTTSASTSPKTPTSGTSGVHSAKFLCDGCGEEREPGDDYAAIVQPPDRMWLFHADCVEIKTHHVLHHVLDPINTFDVG